MDIKKTWLFTQPIAHRGLHNSFIPENSIGAFKNAAENGFPVELDLRLIDDGTIVVFHDETLCRLTRSDGYVAGLTKSGLKDIKLFTPEGEKATEWHIPTFEEVLEEIGGKTPILIETKGQAACAQFEGKIIEILRRHMGEYAVQSFNPYSMEYFKINAFEIPRGQISMRFAKKDLSGAIKRRVLTRLKTNHISQPDFVSYRAEDLPNKFVNKTKLPVLGWTVRSNTDHERFKPFCNNIIFEHFIPETTKNEKE